MLDEDVACTVVSFLDFYLCFFLFTEFVLVADTQLDKVKNTSDSPQAPCFPGDWPVTHFAVTDHS